MDVGVIGFLMIDPKALVQLDKELDQFVDFLVDLDQDGTLNAIELAAKIGIMRGRVAQWVDEARKIVEQAAKMESEAQTQMRSQGMPSGMAEAIGRAIRDRERSAEKQSPPPVIRPFRGPRPSPFDGAGSAPAGTAMGRPPFESHAHGHGVETREQLDRAYTEVHEELIGRGNASVDASINRLEETEPGANPTPAPSSQADSEYGVDRARERLAVLRAEAERMQEGDERENGDALVGDAPPASL